jgi:transcriptional regulator with XRE-family HTH domain
MADNFFRPDAQSDVNTLDSLSTDEFLTLVGQRIRVHRTAERMSRKRLAEVSGVSERYLAQLEAGQGNMSIALLRKVTKAVNLPLNELLAEVEQDRPAQAVEEEVPELI